MYLVIMTEIWATNMTPIYLGTQALLHLVFYILETINIINFDSNASTEHVPRRFKTSGETSSNSKILKIEYYIYMFHSLSLN